jgi:deazaflavin-dependent oxidoreductase (nitroreductase family)
LGFDALVLTTIGRKSGRERQTPVGWFPGKDDGWLIVASAAGAARNPAWFHNLAAHPDKVWMEMPGRKVA